MTDNQMNEVIQLLREIRNTLMSIIDKYANDKSPKKKYPCILNKMCSR